MSLQLDVWVQCGFKPHDCCLRRKIGFSPGVSKPQHRPLGRGVEGPSFCVAQPGCAILGSRKRRLPITIAGEYRRVVSPQPPCDNDFEALARVAKLADARDLKSRAPKRACRFDSGPGHHTTSYAAFD